MEKNVYEIYSEIKGWEKPETNKDRVKEFELNYLPFIKNNLNSKILDVGCGLGYFLDFLKKNGYKNYEGIDINDKLVLLCNLKGHKAIQIDALDFFKLTNETYDIIVFNDVLEHFKKEDSMILIESAKNKLNKDGILIARVPNANYIFSNTFRYRDFTHELIYEIESLEYLFKLYGYEIIYLGGFFILQRNYLRELLRKVLLKVHLMVMFIMNGEIRPNELNIFIIAKNKD